MIDFTNYEYGARFILSITNNNIIIKVTAKLNEIEYSIYRKPFLANLLVEESDNSLIPENSIMVLEVKLVENTDYKFILKIPDSKSPNKFARIKAKICSEKIYKFEKSLK